MNYKSSDREERRGNLLEQAVACAGTGAFSLFQHQIRGQAS